jgi:TRAP-type C4-dicarboxylate transport system permease large subunit
MGTIPFHIIMFVLLFLLTAFPQLALWLPGQM